MIPAYIYVLYMFISWPMLDTLQTNMFFFLNLVNVDNPIDKPKKKVGVVFVHLKTDLSTGSRRESPLTHY